MLTFGCLLDLSNSTTIYLFFFIVKNPATAYMWCYSIIDTTCMPDFKNLTLLYDVSEYLIASYCSWIISWWRNMCIDELWIIIMTCLLWMIPNYMYNRHDFVFQMQNIRILWFGQYYSSIRVVQGLFNFLVF